MLLYLSQSQTRVQNANDHCPLEDETLITERLVLRNNRTTWTTMMTTMMMMMIDAVVLWSIKQNERSHIHWKLAHGSGQESHTVLSRLEEALGDRIRLGTRARFRYNLIQVVVVGDWDWAQFAVRCAHLEIRSWNGYQWHSPKAL